jgi:hypothetical protein
MPFVGGHLSILIGAALVGCASAGIPPPPPELDAPSGWIEMRSAHFTLRTDLHHDQAFRSLYRLERTRAALAHLLGERGGLEVAPLEVIQVRLRTEMAEFGVESFGTTLTSTPIGPLLIIGGEVDRQRDFEAAATLGGYMVHEHHHHQPYWLTTGLGDWVGSLRFVEGTDEVQVGGALFGPQRRGGPNATVYEGPGDLTWLRAHGRLSAASLFAYSPSQLRAEDEPRRFHATAWLLITFLGQTRSDAFRAYQARLEGGEPFDTAWSTSFPDLTPSTIDHVLQVFLDESVFLAERFPSPPGLTREDPLEGFAQRALSADEVHGVRALLFLAALGPRAASERQALARAELQKEQGTPLADSSSLEAALAWSAPAALRSAAGAVAAARPDDPRAWRAWSSTEVDPSRRAILDQALDHLIGLQPTAADALQAKAELLLGQGQALSALPYAERAFALRQSPAVMALLARGLAGVGRCAEGRAWAGHARATLNPSDQGPTAWSIDAAEREVLTSCAATSAVAPPPPP